MITYYLEFIVILAVFVVITFLCFRFIIRNMHSNKSNFFLVIWSLLLAFLLIEVFFRFLYVKSDGFGILSRNFELKYYKYDEYGFRDSSLPLSLIKKNVIVLGDSIVLGHGLKDPNSRYSNILRQKLPDKHIVNMGRKAASTKDEITFLLENYRQGAKTELILLNYYFNDIEGSIPQEEIARIFRNRSQLDTILQKVLLFSETGKYIFLRLLNLREKTARRYQDLLENAYKDKSILENHLQSLKVLKYISEEIYESKLIVAVWPHLGDVDYPDRRTIMLEVFDDLDFSYIDITEVLSQYDVANLIVSERDLHPNEFANKIVADFFYEYIWNHPAK